MIRVLLVDDQDLVRAGLRMLCEAQADIEIVGEARTGSEAVRLAGELVPDVVVMDLRMPGMGGTTATQLILQARPAIRVVVLTTFDDDDHLYPALAAGACGFLTKDAAPKDLLAAIRQAAAGESAYSPEVLRRLVDSAVRSRTGATAPDLALPELSPRERDVLGCLGRGMTNLEIADRLHIGVTTVKTHVANLMERTGSANRVHLAILAVRNDLVPEMGQQIRE
jgi:DNA-binding NarL/FixJ family response regulator